MSFIKQLITPIERTIFQTDVALFHSLLSDEKLKSIDYVDNRLLVMVGIGILNRTINLEDYLVAVVSQKWKFNKQVEIGETISLKYCIHFDKQIKKRYVYDIHIELFADNQTVAEGIWGVMLNNKI
ncbi:hypothetical protein [Psychrobacillus sp. BL-248-WT-3]|uniref:hypothetical protein n=1 Tax=Psychrobacillus sp. BL-248-WT-3 TaxID=2725306 RepID=UPI00146DA12D|nr:hypothetical protein [Psychrobacillus sp. BL-248-WT-3]NME06957.1 hypothetical protein [Psychrobacillus sp. BL-248-WT-3]